MEEAGNPERGTASFLFHRIRVSKDTLTFIDFCLYLENLTRIDFRIGYLENLQNASLVFFILIMLSLFWRHNEPSYFHNPIAFLNSELQF